MATQKLPLSELRSFVEVEVDVLGSPSLVVSVDVKHHSTNTAVVDRGYYFEKRKGTPVRTDAVPCTIKDQIIPEDFDSHMKTLYNQHSEEETGKSRKGKGHWVTDISATIATTSD